MQAEPKARRPRRMARSPKEGTEKSLGAMSVAVGNKPADPEPIASENLTPCDTMALVVAASQTKTAQVIALLERPCGASLDELIATTGWLPHTCRAFLTGLRKKGKAIERSKREDGTTIYKLTSAKAEA